MGIENHATDDAMAMVVFFTYIISVLLSGLNFLLSTRHKCVVLLPFYTLVCGILLHIALVGVFARSAEAFIEFVIALMVPITVIAMWVISYFCCKISDDDQEESGMQQAMLK